MDDIRGVVSVELDAMVGARWNYECSYRGRAIVVIIAMAFLGCSCGFLARPWIGAGVIRKLQRCCL